MSGLGESVVRGFPEPIWEEGEVVAWRLEPSGEIIPVSSFIEELLPNVEPFKAETEKPTRTLDEMLKGGKERK